MNYQNYDLEVLIARQRPRAVKAATLKPFHTMLERYRTLPKVTIAKIGGARVAAAASFCRSAAAGAPRLRRSSWGSNRQ